MQVLKGKNKTIEVVKVTSNIRKGDIVEKEMVTTTTIGGYNISSDYASDPNEVIGKYAIADFYPNDFVQKAKVAENLPSVEGELLKLDGKYEAISVNLKDFARGLSDKLISGDIVSCKVTQETGTFTPVELKYLKVITTTMPSGVDKENSGDKDDENLATITVYATSQQAELLAEYDKKAEIHFTLVYRGDDDTAKQFIEKQAVVLEQLAKQPTIKTEVTTNE